jgi:hypothetical protein
MTSRTSTPEPERKSPKVPGRLPTPSELDSWPGLDTVLDELLPEHRSKANKSPAFDRTE